MRVYARFADDLSTFPRGERLRVVVDLDRNGKFSALYHLMLGRLARAINRGPASTNINTLKKWVKLKRGWFDLVDVQHPTLGTMQAIDYKSTAFAKMGEEEFHRFAVDTCDLIRAELAPWVSQSPEWAEIAGIIATIAPEDAA
ncbi:hypothetical protein [uncultured Amaricoccus sp.]|uniref:hypothetical protein n=1 Tax=uncultured Amaricoccus sp. TaxID=339341 RepID=UPI0026035D72|nr:hypothetical protein [uncultured Amaricoccus sp.]